MPRLPGRLKPWGNQGEVIIYRNAIICVILVLLTACWYGTALAADPPDPERPQLVRGEKELVPLGAGVRWWMPDKLRQGLVPRATKVKVPKIDFEGLTTLGVAWKVEWDGGPLRVPVELEFKLPQRAFREGVRVVMIRQDETGTATVYINGFSTWIPAEMADAVGYIHTTVKGNLNLVPECEQDPEVICHRLRPGGRRTGQLPGARPIT